MRGDGEATEAPAPSTPDGKGARFAGGRSTPPRTAADDDTGSEREPPERMVLVPLASMSGAEGEGAADRRCLLVRLRGSKRISLLDLPRPAPGETLSGVVAGLLNARLGVRPAGEPWLAPGRVASRLPREGRGTWEQGWRRAVVVAIEGEPSPDALVEDVLALPIEEALASLSTDAERSLLALARP
ncbi:MAG: hypothetical protein OXC94_10930 [Chloroflexi bacterium]|nr:hypothetical protein [Chloroflexota bacterium]